MNAKEEEYFCLYCGVKLDFVPTEDGGFCSIECEDSYYETGSFSDAEPDLTEGEKYDGGVMSNFDNENPKEVEDYINEKPA